MANEMTHTGFSVKKNGKLYVDGVKSVDSFESEFVTLELSCGGMNVEGDKMKIESLTQSSGEVVITGNITGVFYTKQPKKKGLIASIFG